MSDDLRTRIYSAVLPICRSHAQRITEAAMEAIPTPTPLPPGAELRRVLEAMGMSQADLARATGLSAKHVNQVCQGTAALSYETAIKLEDVTGVPASWWNAAEAAYRTALLRGVCETWRGPAVAP